MNSLRAKLGPHAAALRTVPFLVFLGLTYGQGQFGEASRYWFYALKTLVGVWMLWVVWPLIREMRWRFSWEAVVAGVAVFGIWVGLDGWYPSLGDLWCGLTKLVGIESGCGESATEPAAVWNPHIQFGDGSGLAWFFVIVRLAGSSLVVPPLEEVFYRSFLYRYIADADFEKIDLGTFLKGPFLGTALLFGLAHHQWLAGILCAMIYQGLVIRKKRLGDAMTAHAITNALLGVWIIWKNDWHFW